MLLTGPKKGMSRMPGVAKFESPTVPCHFCDPTRLGGSKLTMSAFGNDSGLLKKIVRMADIYLVTLLLVCRYLAGFPLLFSAFVVAGEPEPLDASSTFKGKVG